MKLSVLKRGAITGLVFALVDLILFFMFGVMFLNNMEFTSLKILSEETDAALFSWKDYLVNCTLFCLLEDLAITVLYFACLWRSPGQGSKTEVVYLWLVHVNIKVLLNVHSTGMFLSALEYARESGWESLKVGVKDFTRPLDCFAEQRMSLLLGLSVLALTFGIVLFYTEWKKHPTWYFALFVTDVYLFLLFSSKAGFFVKLLGAGLGVALVGLFHIRKPVLRSLDQLLHSIWEALPEQAKAAGRLFLSPRNDLYGCYVRGASVAFILFTAAWAFIRFAVIVSDNKNSLFGVQYSSVLKLLTPVFLVGNLVVRRIEQSRPDKYVQHSPNLYIWNTLLMIGSGCMALVLFGEFGSIVCVLGLTVVMFLLFVDMPELRIRRNESFLHVLWKVIRVLLVSGLTGFLGGLSLAAAENALFQRLLKSIGLKLGGEVAGLRLDSFPAEVFGWLCAALLVLLAGLSIVSLFLSSSDLVFSFFRMLRIGLLNLRERFVGRLNIHKLPSGRNGGTAKKRIAALDNHLSVGIALALAAGMLLYFNFFLNIYGGTTILKQFYMTAGDFDNEFEITENITQTRMRESWDAYKRMKEKEEALRNGEPAPTEPTAPEVPDDVKEKLAARSEYDHPGKNITDYGWPSDPSWEWEELRTRYNPEVYTRPVHLKLMQLIDRLCYSTRTAELSAVQQGLKRNMEFEVSQLKDIPTYISSLQTKYYVKKADVLASESLRELCFKADGSLKDTFRFWTAAGEESTDDDKLYLWYLTDANGSFFVKYEDETTETYSEDFKEFQRMFKSAEPTTASSDYMLYTLSRMGVGNLLVLIFTQYFSMIILLLVTNAGLSLTEITFTGCMRYALCSLGSMYAISFVIQTIVIVCGVFGVSLFSGLTLPLVAAGHCEMLLNSICMAVLLMAVSDPYKERA